MSWLGQALRTLPVTGQEEGEAPGTMGRRPSERGGNGGLGGGDSGGDQISPKAGLLSGASPADSTPLKIWSWVRYQVGMGQEENGGDTGVMQVPCLTRQRVRRQEWSCWSFVSSSCLLVLYLVLGTTATASLPPGLHIVSGFG